MKAADGFDTATAFADLVQNIQGGNCRSMIMAKSLDFICHWTASDIANWSKLCRSMSTKDVSHDRKQVETDFLREALAVANRATQLTMNYTLTPIQILSAWLPFIKDAKKKEGLLLQIGTGMGKSTIIAVTATILSMLGIKADIYTSSPVLAERDAKEWTSFYSLFGLTCDHN